MAHELVDDERQRTGTVARWSHDNRGGGGSRGNGNNGASRDRGHVNSGGGRGHSDRVGSNGRNARPAHGDRGGRSPSGGADGDIHGRARGSSIRDAAGGEPDFEIVDHTSPEQVAREQTLLATGDAEDLSPVAAVAGAASHAPGSADQHDLYGGPGQPGLRRSSVDPGLRGSAEQNGFPDLPGSSGSPDLPNLPNLPDSQNPQHLVYSHDEVAAMRAAWARQVDEARRDASRAGGQLNTVNLDAAVEAVLQQQERELAGSVGTEQAAKVARSPQNRSLIRQSITNQQRLMQSGSEQRRALEQQQDRQEQQARLIVARALAQENGVSTDDFDLLASASTPVAMKRLAMRLGGRDAKAMRQLVPPENDGTELENGYHAGPAPESAARRLERIRSRPSWEWTEADLRYMKTGEVK